MVKEKKSSKTFPGFFKVGNGLLFIKRPVMVNCIILCLNNGNKESLQIRRILFAAVGLQLQTEAFLLVWSRALKQSGLVHEVLAFFLNFIFLNQCLLQCCSQSLFAFNPKLMLQIHI